MNLSKNRVENVKAMLVKLGVEPSRVDYKGDTVQPFAENAKNRVVTCTLE
jgi:outer membrane protein OmpA-like peptidoglycan-associated protein